jgi:DNA-binding IclR family transcriptional regulator
VIRSGRALTRRAPKVAAVGSQYTKSLGRALAILKAFKPDRPRLALSEVAQAVDIDKATVRRLLLTMHHHGFIDQDAQSRQYMVGPAVLEVGASVPTNREIRDIARPPMLRLMAQTHLSVFLGVHSEYAARCLERVEPNSPVLVRLWTPGGLLPLNCGAGPRVLLAWLPQAEIQTVIRHHLGVATPKSRVRTAVLVRELRRIRERGWDYTADDVMIGAAALGVPIRDRAGTVVAALSIAGLTHQLADRKRCLAALRDTAAAISAQLVSE